MASTLYTWLPNVIQAIEPLMSEEDIEKGARWGLELDEMLESANFGILCLTPENLKSLYIHFEAGALSKSINESRVCPYLLGLEEDAITGPLTKFQSTKSDRQDTFRLIKAINGAIPSDSLSYMQLNSAFEKWWPELELSLSELRQCSLECEEENREFLKFLCGSRKQFIQMAAPLASAKRWAESYDSQVLMEISSLGANLLEGIAHEEDNLRIHSSMIRGAFSPVVESRKDEYLYSLRRLKIATRNLMIPPNPNDRREELGQFEIARGDAITDRDLLIKALSKSLSSEDAQNLCEDAGLGIKFFAGL